MNLWIIINRDTGEQSLCRGTRLDARRRAIAIYRRWRIIAG